jgi:hypothetical protein
MEAKSSIDFFLGFLPTYESDATAEVRTLADVTQTCVDAYFAFIDASTTPSGTPYKLTTISNLRSPLRQIFKKLRTLEFEGGRMPTAVDFPTMGDRGRKQAIRHVSPLDAITTVRVVLAAFADIERYALMKPIPGFPVDTSGRILTNVPLDEMLARLTKLESAQAQPLTMRETVPFVLILALTSSFNVSSLLEAPQGALKKSHPLYKRKRWQLQIVKPKAKHRTQKRSFAVEQYTWANPVYVLAALEVYTRSLRDKVPAEVSGRIFLAVHSRGAAALYTTNDGATGAFEDALRQFCVEHEIEPFSLQRLRSTSSEIVHEITDGDILAQNAALQHSPKNLDLDAETYSSVRAVWRDTERLAKGMVFREAFIRSGGKVDARIALGDASRGLRAATPGFACVDIYDSPYPGQQKGAACAAYCMCPGCPLGAANVYDAFSVARLLQVEQALIKAHTVMNEERWMADYADQLDELRNRWLPLVRISIMKAARALELPAIPEVE